MFKYFLMAATCLLVVTCGKKKEEDYTGSKTFNVVSNVEGRASIFSNAGSTVREADLSASPAKVEFPATSTRLIGVIPALGISEGRASSVRLEVPATQLQSTPGKDDLQGGFLYAKGAAADNPVRLDFEPMGHTIAVAIKAPSSDKLRGVLLTSNSSGLTGVATLDLFKYNTIGAIPGGGKQVSVSLPEAVQTGDEAVLYLHIGAVKCANVQMKVVMASCYYQVIFSATELDFSKPGETIINLDLVQSMVSIGGQEDMGASIAKSDGGDFSSLLVLDDEETDIDHIPDFSRAGYKYGDEAIPSPAVAATIDIASISAALANHSAADTTDYIQKVIDRVGGNGGGAILFKNGTYNVSRILFLDFNNTVLRGESESGTIIKNNSTIQVPIVYMGASMLKQSGEQETESITFVAGRRVAISKMKVNGTGGNSSYGSTYLITYSPRTPGRTYGSNSVIMEDYVPVGRLYVEVRNPSLFKPGDAVCIYRPATQKWLDDIGMTRIASNGRESGPVNQWDTSTYSFHWTRKVTAVNGNRVYLDSPVVQSIESRYGGGELQKYTQTRVTGSGVENMSFDCSYDTNNVYNGNEVDEAHAWNAVLVKSAEHCWIRNVTSRHMGYGLANMGGGARCITIEKCTCLSPVSIVSGARRYAFCCSEGSELCLFKDCFCEYDRHSFVTNGPSLGPNVFTNCKSERGFAAIGPHWGWATGTLYDCVLSDSNFEAQDGGNQGTGHGWRGMATVFWNISSSGKQVVCQNAWGTCPNGHQWNRTDVCSQCGATVVPSGRNYAVGVNGLKTSHTVYWDKDYMSNATTDFFVDLYGYGQYGYNRPDGCWYPEREFNTSGGDFITLPYEAPVDWWPIIKTTRFTQPYSLYQCQLEDRHSRGVYLNTL